jgi:lipoprotein signal peptidase
VVVPAAGLAAADLIVKATMVTPPWHFHTRSNSWVLLSVALLVAALLLSFVPSRVVAVAAGVMSGGVLGNLLSASLDGNRVPNPLQIGDATGGIAFNLADVFFLGGNVLLTVALMALTIQHRGSLIPPRAWERALRQRLRS